MKDFDIIVVGAGSGGIRLARTCASMGARVAIIEADDFGGACVNVGCIPKKLFVYASEIKEEMSGFDGLGWDIGSSQFSWNKLLLNKDTEITRLNDLYENLIAEHEIEVIKGFGKVTGPNEVTVNDRVLITRYIVLATGSWPTVPSVPGKEHIITSNEMFFLDELPRSAVIWGGGYIGLEFAGILNGFGVEVTVVNRGDKLLNGFDHDVSEFIAKEIQKKGIKVLTGTNIEAVTKVNNGLKVDLNNETSVRADIVMAATGRKARVRGVGLEATGVELTGSDHIAVSENLQTSVPSIYAIGDVIGTPQLAPVALEQAMVLAKNLFEGGEAVVDYNLIPSAVFCQPNVGVIGMSEQEAKANGHEVTVYKTEFTPLKNRLSKNTEKTMMKLVVDAKSDRVLGAHMVGKDAGEIVQGLAVAIRLGATKKDLDSTMGVHPTSAEEFLSMRTPS